MDKTEILQFISQQKTAFIGSVNEQGYPVIRAMLAPRKIDGNEIYLLDKIEAREDSSVGQTENLLNHMMLEQLLEELSVEEKKLIILRYYKEKTQTEVAKELGISQVQVSRLEKKILLRMRGKM